MMFGFFKKKNEFAPTGASSTRVDYDDPSIIAEYFEKKTGVSFKKQVSILKSKLTSFCKIRHIECFDSLFEMIEADTKLEQELVDYLTTNESYFYREFFAIKQMVDEIVDSNQKVDILCAPCSTGEEPYSIAIALMESGVAQTNFNIIGIDINREALEKAEQASYRSRNISKMPAELVPKYFTCVDERYHLKQSVKSCVSFSLVNIFEPAVNQIGQFDYVLSRNMLIYFDSATRKKATGILQSLLKNPAAKVIYGHADLY